ncbi:sulfite exporter TauE/SafE family protein [Oscillatoria sp. CS-180]|uniref:sulfite exporter TauE/SafE family protein n=1 Tax=Oscillatoria sp. CS-180 TaxID=3021720 RepID=UPI00232E6C67|nr:sulfite exporter TauE/SafE family protein [Oscillatoria sp. CS-180]MDB9524660.1 sulfite exporter TauE/SafE family protein [Oscillatoria sp. CS-180]
MLYAVGHLFAIAIGMSLGLLGSGGSVLALPVLVYIMGIPPKSAIAMTLIIVGLVSLIGVMPHWRQGNLNGKIAISFGSSTMLGAYLGARLATQPWITTTFQMGLFGVAMLLAAGLMIRRTAKSEPSPDIVQHEAFYQPPVCKYCWLWLMTEGLGVGVVTGLVGVGGGFAIVPALVLLGKIPMKQAIGTSLLIIAGNSIAGLLGYLGQIDLDWQLTVSFTFAASLGTGLGNYLGRFISARQLQKGFGYFLLAIATFVLIKNYAQFRSLPTSSAPTTNNRIGLAQNLTGRVHASSGSRCVHLR